MKNHYLLIIGGVIIAGGIGYIIYQTMQTEKNATDKTKNNFISDVKTTATTDLKNVQNKVSGLFVASKK